MVVSISFITTLYIVWLVNMGRKNTHVKIPFGFLSTATIAELVLDSDIFFAASKTVLFGSTVTVLETP